MLHSHIWDVGIKKKEVNYEDKREKDSVKL